MTDPLKRTSSSGLTFDPSSVTICPLTATRPAVIRSSASRREQIPELAIKRFRRIAPAGFGAVESRVAARPAVTMRMSCSLLFRSVALVAHAYRGIRPGTDTGLPCRDDCPGSMTSPRSAGRRRAGKNGSRHRTVCAPPSAGRPVHTGCRSVPWAHLPDSTTVPRGRTDDRIFPGETRRAGGCPS